MTEQLADLAVRPSAKRVAQNPYEGNNRRRGPSAVGTYRSSNKVMMGAGTRLFKKKRKPPWK